MILKSKKYILILDVVDIETKTENEKMRKGALPDGEYEVKYRNLKHLYLHKKWFVTIAKQCNCKIDFFDLEIKDYRNSQFRFNVLMEIM